MDTLDLKALALLRQNARMTWAELAQNLGLSSPAAAERVRKLEEQGIIKGYSALLDAEAVGYPLVAFVFVTLHAERKRTSFIKALNAMPQVAEVHHIAGEDDYLLKVRARTMADLDHLLSAELKDKLGVARTRTTMVLTTAKESYAPPVVLPS